MIEFNASIMEPIVDKKYWNSRDLLTVHELVYLLHESLPNPYHLHKAIIQEFDRLYPHKPISKDYQESLDKFESMVKEYYKIETHAKSLPMEITDNTHVRWDFQDGETKMECYGYEPRFLINWIEERGYKMPSWFNPIESIHHKQQKSEQPNFDSSEIMIDGWVNVRKIESTKLVLAIESYINNMSGKDPHEVPSSKVVKAELVEKYGKDGVVDAMARVIDECSRHDLIAKSPPISARKKTIFFQ